MSAEQVYGKPAGNPSRNGAADLARRLASLSAPQRQAILVKALRAATAVEGEYGRGKVGRGARPHVMEAAVFLSHILYVQRKGTIRRGWAWQSSTQIEDETGLREYDLRRVRDLAGEGGLGFLASEYDRLRHRKFYRVPCDSHVFMTLVEPLVKTAEAKARERGAPSVHMDGSGAVHMDGWGNVDVDGSENVHMDGSSSNVTTDETTDDTPDVINHAPAGESGADHRGPVPSRDDGGMDAGEVSKDASTTPPPVPETPGKSGTEGPGGRSRPGLRGTSRGFATLPESMLEEALALPALELSVDATEIGRQLCRDLGRPYAPEGLAARLAEECIRRGLPEALGAVAAKASRDDVRSPDGYLRTYIAGEINERKDHMQPGGDPVARFRVAREEELTRLITASMVRGGKSRGREDSPAQDAEGRQSLTGRSAAPIYGVGDPVLERDPEDYFVLGGSRGAAPR